MAQTKETIQMFYIIRILFAAIVLAPISISAQPLRLITWGVMHNGEYREVAEHLCERQIGPGRRMIGALTPDEINMGHEEAFYRRHLRNIQTEDIQRNHVKLDEQGQVVAWNGGADGGAVTFVRDNLGQVIQIQIAIVSNSPAITIDDADKISEYSAAFNNRIKETVAE